MERRNIYFCGVAEIGERKGGKCLEKENIFFVDENEKEKNIWRRKIYFLWGRIKMEKEENIYLCRVEGKGGKFLKRENVFFAGGKENGEGTGGKYLEKENIFFAEDKEKEDNIWKRKIYLWWRRIKTNQKEENIRRRKLIFCEKGG